MIAHYKLAVDKFDLLIGNYHQLRHAAIPTTGGKRYAITCYSSVLVEDFLALRQHSFPELELRSPQQ